MGSKRINASNRDKIEGLDLISDLPDAIIAHIFSFLPTKDAVAASILSRRYKFLWTQVPVIDVGEHVYFHSGAFEKRVQFKNFVSNILLRNKEPCLRFCGLTIPHDIDSLCANAWIEAIAVREVNEMHLRVSCSVKLPFLIFEKLVVLKLMAFPDLDMTSLCIPNLRVLNFNVIDLNGLSLLRSLSSSCPVLQELVIRRCELWIGSEGKLHVCSSTLKKLEIRDMLFVSVAVIDTPSLEYLMISEYINTTYYASDLSSLREADLSISVLCYGELDSERRRDNLKFINTLTSSSTLRLIRTKFEFEDIEERMYHLLPVFDNLTCLELDIYESCRCIVPALLECTPNLVNLIVTCTPVYPDFDFVREYKCSHETHVPRCLLNSIKSIKIRDFDDSEESAEIVRYLLMNARVLNEMRIRCWYKLSPTVEMEIIRELLSFPRGSPTSTVSFFAPS